MLFRMLYDEKLAQASYLIGCQRTEEAIVIDPERDVERYLDVAAGEGMNIVAVAETHIHADFLSGARELAEKTGALLYLSDEGDADWKYRWLDKRSDGGSYDHRLVVDGDRFQVGNIHFEVLSTPGHTPEHISFLVTDRGGGASEPMGIATGDFVFVGDVGRPDLLETAAGVSGAKEESARTLYRSLQRFKELPDYLQVWPGHGAGSACGKALGAVPQSTVGYEKRFNPAIGSAEDEGRFLHEVLHGQTEPPLYFTRMKRENKEGPALLGTPPTPALVRVEAIQAARRGGAVVLDTRAWELFSQGHLDGSLYAPLLGSFPTVAGSYIDDPTTPIYLVIENERVDEAVIDLIRIGLDNVVGYIVPDAITEWAKRGDAKRTASMHITDLASDPLPADALILDVRRADEYESGHIDGALNIAHTHIVKRLDDVPRDRPLFVHCRTDNRSAHATALLQSRGYDVTHLRGGITAWLAASGEVTVPKSVKIP